MSLFGPRRAPWGFGVELELTALPRHTIWREDEDLYEFYQRGYISLRTAMREKDLQVNMITFNQNGTFKKYPSDYTRWFLTHDRSVKGRDEDAIPIEVVSRKFSIPAKDWMNEVISFWEAFYKVFDLETSNIKCGSHVHVAPLESSYSMRQLRIIAYAVIIYEKHVLEILPRTRRHQHYCQPNTNVSPDLKELFQEGRSKDSYADLRDEIDDISDATELHDFMQGNHRNTLWNFKNLLDNDGHESGTIEFRGLPGVHSAQETIHWILFAVGFIILALEEDKLGKGGDFTYVKPGTAKLQRRTQELWERIDRVNREKLTKKWLLPVDYQDMYDRESRRSKVRSGSRSSSRSISPVRSNRERERALR